MHTTTDILMRQRIVYPESDGKPLGKTDVHRREIAQIIEMLTLYFQSTAAEGEVARLRAELTHLRGEQ